MRSRRRSQGDKLDGARRLRPRFGLIPTNDRGNFLQRRLDQRSPVLARSTQAAIGKLRHGAEESMEPTVHAIIAGVTTNEVSRQGAEAQSGHSTNAAHSLRLRASA